MQTEVMSSDVIGSRNKETNVDTLFLQRWSPRSFDENYELSYDELITLLDAARWSPSSFNEQPWTFHVALRGSEAFDEFLEPMDESNQVWAKNACALMYVSGKKFFSKTGKPNTTFEYDCGSAWMSLTLQARLMGLYTHGMVGFDRDEAAEVLDVDQEKEKVIAALAVGRRDMLEKLPPKLQQMEKLSDRKPLKQVFHIY